MSTRQQYLCLYIVDTSFCFLLNNMLSLNLAPTQVKTLPFHFCPLVLHYFYSSTWLYFAGGYMPNLLIFLQQFSQLTILFSSCRNYLWLAFVLLRICGLHSWRFKTSSVDFCKYTTHSHLLFLFFKFLQLSVINSILICSFFGLSCLVKCKDNVQFGVSINMI